MPENESSEFPQERTTATLKSVLTSEGFSAQDEVYDQAADKALKERPYFSIRVRLILTFSIFFVLTLGIILWIIHTLAEVTDRIDFIEVADDYKVEIQQARRFEKNFLLYGTNLKDAREHAQAAQRLSAENSERFRKILGEQGLEDMEQHMVEYIVLLDALGGENRAQYEARIREHGADLYDLAQELVEKERTRIHSALGMMRMVPFVFLGALFVLMLVVGGFLVRQILGTLSRFMGYTDRIASGDFTPITPRRKYRDEFSRLALTINRMVRELDRQHRILMESHKLRAMGTLVAGVAHELNNPLNNLLLTASLLQEEYEALDDEERQEMLQDLSDQADRAKNIVANLLDFARQSDTQLEPLDLVKIVEETTTLIGNQLRVKKVRLTKDLPETLPAVHGDRQLLSQVFMNLILNALDVLPAKGEIRITTSAERREGFLAVDVADNGPGMPRHILEQIFDPFFTTKPKGKGTGLGLSVSRGIVRKLGGYLLVESRMGVGTTFTVLVPITGIPSDISRGAASVEGGT